MLRNLMIASLAAMMMVIMVPAAQASNIDFTDNFWSGATNQTEFSQVLDELNFPGLGGITVTLESLVDPDDLTQPKLYWDTAQKDGIGIKGYGDQDEFDTEPQKGDLPALREILRVSFSAPITVYSFTISDLFANEGGPGKHEVIHYSLSGDLNLFDGSVVAPPENNQASGGFVTVNTGGIVTESLTFWADNGSFVIDDLGSPNNFRGHDASLAGISTVPEPGTMILFGSAAGILGYIRRRKLKK